MSTDVADMDDLDRLRADLESQINALRCTQGFVPDDLYAAYTRGQHVCEAVRGLATEALNRCTAIEERLAALEAKP